MWLQSHAGTLGCEQAYKTGLYTHANDLTFLKKTEKTEGGAGSPLLGAQPPPEPLKKAIARSTTAMHLACHSCTANKLTKSTSNNGVSCYLQPQADRGTVL